MAPQGREVLLDRFFRVALVLKGLIAFLVVFIAYQGYVMAIGFTWGMLALTVFDIVIVWLTAREYRVHKATWPPGHLATRRFSSR